MVLAEPVAPLVECPHKQCLHGFAGLQIVAICLVNRGSESRHHVEKCIAAPTNIRH
jgi:hypothetical protein